MDIEEIRQRVGIDVMLNFEADRCAHYKKVAMYDSSKKKSKKRKMYYMYAEPGERCPWDGVKKPCIDDYPSFRLENIFISQLKYNMNHKDEYKNFKNVDELVDYLNKKYSGPLRLKKSLYSYLTYEWVRGKDYYNFLYKRAPKDADENDCYVVEFKLLGPHKFVVYAPGGKKLMCVNSACYAFQDKDKYDKYWEIEHLAALIKTSGDWKKQMKIYGWI